MPADAARASNHADRKPGAARAAASFVAAGLASAALLAIWNVLEVGVREEPYRRSPARALDLLSASFTSYLLIAFVPVVVVCLILAAVGRARRIRKPGGAVGPPVRDVPVIAGCGVTVFLFYLGLARDPGAGQAPVASFALDLLAACAASIAAGIAAGRIVASLRRSARRIAAARNILTLVCAGPCALVVWEIVRDYVAAGRSLVSSLIVLAVSVAAGLAAAWVGRRALGIVADALGRLAQIPIRTAAVRIAVVAGAAVAVALLASRIAFYVGGPGGAGPAAGKPNVLVLVGDTLRADHIGCYGAAGAHTPHIDALAAKGVRVEETYSSAPWTAPATASLLTGLYPDGHGLISYRDRIRPDVISVATLFRRAGYDTAGFSGNPILTPRYGFGHGFTTWQEDLFPGWIRRHPHAPVHATSELLGLSGPPTHFPRAAEVVRRGLDWLRRPRKAPFFLYLHFMDPHDPYDPPPAWRPAPGEGSDKSFRMEIGTLSSIMAAERRAGGAELRRMEELYAGEISYLDDQIGRVLHEVDSLGLTGKTIVVFTADHGEEFLDHGDLEHTRTLYEEIVRIPLVIEGPGIAPGRVMRGPVRQVDIAPTLLEAAGIGHPEKMDGSSVWPTLARGAPLAERDAFMSMVYFGVRSPWHGGMGVRHENMKLIATSPSSGGTGPWSLELYDLLHDPKERHDLSGARAADAAGLKKTLDAWSTRPTAKGRQLSPEDEETRRKLKALGYVD